MSRHPEQDQLITHQKMLQHLPCEACKYCTRHTKEWQQFMEGIDTVVPLSTQKMHAGCQRVTTRALGGAINLETQQTWLPHHTDKEVQQLQREDADHKMVQLWFDEGEVPSREYVDQHSPAVCPYYLSWDTLKRENGIIYREWYPDEEKQPTQSQMLVPKVLRQEILQQCHNTPLGGHRAIAKTLGKVRQKYHWYGVTMDVKLHIQRCPVCAANSKPTKKYKAPLGEY